MRGKELVDESELEERSSSSRLVAGSTALDATGCPRVRLSLAVPVALQCASGSCDLRAARRAMVTVPRTEVPIVAKWHTRAGHAAARE